jgi:hypothetical protein
MTPDEADRLFDQAFKLERRGERQAAITIYERLAEELAGQQQAEYARNCVTRLREYETIARPPEPAFAPGLASLSLVVAQLSCILSCLGSLIGAIVGVYVGLRSQDAKLIAISVVGGPIGFLWSYALFIVFSQTEKLRAKPNKGTETVNR